MKKYIFEKIYDKLFVPTIVGGMAFLGYVIYNQGQADAIHKIYKNGWCVVDDNDVKYKSDLRD